MPEIVNEVLYITPGDCINIEGEVTAIIVCSPDETFESCNFSHKYTEDFGMGVCQMSFSNILFDQFVKCLFLLSLDDIFVRMVVSVYY